MSSVPLPDRETSKTDFNHKLYKVHDDATNLMNINFGAKGENLYHNKEYIGAAKFHISKKIFKLVSYINTANALWPTCVEELHVRRVYQDKAIGVCGELLTMYELIMKHLHIKDDKFTDETRHIVILENSIKNWRTSDNKRFKNIG